MPSQKSDSTVVDGCRNKAPPDYGSVEIPAKPPSQYSYHERRADLLQQVRDLGHPSYINQSEAAERYGVSQQTISKDIDRISESVRERVVDRDSRAFTVDSVVQRAIRGMLDNEEYRQAAKTVMEWDEWLTEFNDLERLEVEIEQLKNDLGDRGGGRR